MLQSAGNPLPYDFYNATDNGQNLADDIERALLTTAGRRYNNSENTRMKCTITELRHEMDINELFEILK